MPLVASQPSLIFGVAGDARVAADAAGGGRGRLADAARAATAGAGLRVAHAGAADAGGAGSARGVRAALALTGAAQLSARVGSQATHAAPPGPQVAVDGVAQVEPEQQPPGQFVVLQSLQTPPAQIRPAQSWQAAPPAPHALLAVPVRQVVPEQQPLGHDVRSQTHAPLTQRWPVPHGAPVPHWQAPVVEH